MAVGVGARKALAASAAINWMLKDGMNRLVRMGVATQFGDSFDSDLKVRGAGARLTLPVCGHSDMLVFVGCGCDHNRESAGWPCFHSCLG